MEKAVMQTESAPQVHERWELYSRAWSFVAALLPPLDPARELEDEISRPKLLLYDSDGAVDHHLANAQAAGILPEQIHVVVKDEHQSITPSPLASVSSMTLGERAKVLYNTISGVVLDLDGPVGPHPLHAVFQLAGSLPAWPVPMSISFHRQREGGERTMKLVKHMAESPILDSLPVLAQLAEHDRGQVLTLMQALREQDLVCLPMAVRIYAGHTNQSARIAVDLIAFGEELHHAMDYTFPHIGRMLRGLIKAAQDEYGEKGRRRV